MSATASLRQTRFAATWILSACAQAGAFGIYLLPVFYVGFFAALLLLWREPQATFWLVAAAGALGWAMVAWALVFWLASMKHAVAPAKRRAASGAAAQPHMRPQPLHFAQMPTRACHQACSTPGGNEACFSVACFHARCPAANSGDTGGNTSGASAGATGRERAAAGR
jgi:hypothetical protein